MLEFLVRTHLQDPPPPNKTRKVNFSEPCPYHAPSLHTVELCPSEPASHPNYTHNLASICAYASWPPAVESSIAVEDAVENRGLDRFSVSRLF